LMIAKEPDAVKQKRFVQISKFLLLITFLSITVVMMSNCSIFSPYPISDNNTFSDSTPLSESTAYGQSRYLSKYDDRDIYAVYPRSNGDYEIRLYIYEEEDFSATLKIYDSEKVQIGDTIYLDSTDFAGNYLLKAKAENYYYIELNRCSGYAEYSIQFRYS